MTTREVLEWWERATPVPYHSAPTLMRPAETHALGGGEHIEVHTDRSGTYRLILVRRKGPHDREEIRVCR